MGPGRPWQKIEFGKPANLETGMWAHRDPQVFGAILLRSGLAGSCVTPTAILAPADVCAEPPEPERSPAERSGGVGGGAHPRRLVCWWLPEL
jgi:hypothetical protein